MPQDKSRYSMSKSHKIQSTDSHKRRDTYKYCLKSGGKVVYVGITNNLERREKEHQSTSPGSLVEKIGRRTTRTAALKWESEAITANGSQVRNAAKRAIKTHRFALEELGRH